MFYRVLRHVETILVIHRAYRRANKRSSARKNWSFARTIRHSVSPLPFLSYFRTFSESGSDPVPIRPDEWHPNFIRRRKTRGGDRPLFKFVDHTRRNTCRWYLASGGSGEVKQNEKRKLHRRPVELAQRQTKHQSFLSLIYKKPPRTLIYFNSARSNWVSGESPRKQTRFPWGKLIRNFCLIVEIQVTNNSQLFMTYVLCYHRIYTSGCWKSVSRNAKEHPRSFIKIHFTGRSLHLLGIPPLVETEGEREMYYKIY